MEQTIPITIQRQFVLRDDKIYFRFEYSPQLISVIKETFSNYEYHPTKKIWSVPYIAISYTKIFKFIEDHQFSELLEKKAESGTSAPKQEIRSKLVISRPTPVIISPNIKFAPRNYQLEGISQMLKYKRFINGDRPGLGKTFQAIAACETANSFPVLVVCPASVKYNWKKEWAKWTTKRTVSVIEGTKDNDWSADVIIINYDIVGKKEMKILKNGNKKKVGVSKYTELDEIKWKTVIADESHFLKNAKALRSQALKNIIKNVEYRYFLSGTIIMNRPIELTNQLTLLGILDDLFGNWRRFAYRYCNAQQTRFGFDTSGASNLMELNKVLTENCYVSREKRDVLDELPEMQETILSFSVTNRREYNLAEANLISYLRETKGKAKADAAERAEHLVLLNTLRQLAVMGKMTDIKEWIENFLETSDEKLVVIGNFRDPLEFLHKEFEGSDIINGGTSSKDKLAKVEKFKTSSNRIMFGNIQSIGTGVDGLQDASSTMLIIDLPQKWSLIEQVEGRLERMGQKNFINIYFGIDEETIDGKVWKLLQKKKFITDAVNKGSVEEVDSQDSMLKELLESYL